MFSFFRPRCPIDPGEKTWIEYRMAWLLKRFSLEQLQNTKIILPTSEFFTLPFHGRLEEVQAVLESVCGYLQVDPARFRANVFNPQNPLGPLPNVHDEHVWEIWAGHLIHEGESPTEQETDNTTEHNAETAWRGVTIHLVDSLAADLETVIALFAREICRSVLLQFPDLTPRTFDFEHTVELMPLFFGLGIFSANAVLRETASNSMGWEQWSMIPQGHLPARYLGFALGLLAWMRQESMPSWRSYLRRDAEGAFRATLKYLEKTGDTVLDREPSAKPYDQQSSHVWFEDLDTGTPSRRVAALWAIQAHAESLDLRELVPLVSRNLEHSDAAVRSTSAETLDLLGQPAAEAVPQLLRAIEDRTSAVRLRAALALGRMTEQAETILPDLLPLLRDHNMSVANAAAWSLGEFGETATEAAPGLVLLLRRVLLHCQEGSESEILEALLSVTKHPEEVVMETLLERDAESCQTLLNLLKAHQLDAEVS